MLLACGTYALLHQRLLAGVYLAYVLACCTLCASNRIFHTQSISECTGELWTGWLHAGRMHYILAMTAVFCCVVVALVDAHPGPAPALPLAAEDG